MALVTTFATTPLTSALFPPWYQKKIAAWKRGEVDWEGNSLGAEDGSSGQGDLVSEKYQGSEIRKLLVCLRLDSLPSLFTFVALLGGEKTSAPTNKTHPTKAGKVTGTETSQAYPETSSLHKRPLEVHGLRMLELTERLSSVMKESEAEEWSHRDPVVNAFHTFGQLNNVAVSGEVQLVPEDSYADVLNERAFDRTSDMILLPWSETGSLSETVTANMTESTHNAFGSASYNQFVSKFLGNAPCNTAILVNNGFGALPREETRSLSRVPTTLSLRSIQGQATAPIIDRSHHIFFPFIGGLDDQIALRFVLRLAKNPNVTATIVHIRGTRSITEEIDPIQTSEDSTTKDDSKVSTMTVQDRSSDQDRAFFTLMADSLPDELESRVVFETIDTTQPVHDSVEHARAEVGLSPKNAGDLVVVGRSRGGSSGLHTVIEGDIQQNLGDLAQAVIRGNVKASVLVIQAGGKGLQV